jgi:hypothetical protein
MSTASLRRIGSPKTARPWLRSVVAGLDDVRDDIGDTQRDRRLDGAVQPHDVRLHAVVGQVLGDQSRIGRRHPATGDLGDVVAIPGAGGIPEGRRPKPSAITSSAAAARVQQQVAAGDAASTVPDPT